GPRDAAQPALLELRLHAIANRFAPLGAAAPAGVVALACIFTDKDVVFVLFHGERKGSVYQARSKGCQSVSHQSVAAVKGNPGALKPGSLLNWTMCSNGGRES